MTVNKWDRDAAIVSSRIWGEDVPVHGQRLNLETMGTPCNHYLFIFWPTVLQKATRTGQSPNSDPQPTCIYTPDLASRLHLLSLNKYVIKYSVNCKEHLVPEFASSVYTCLAKTCRDDYKPVK